MEDLRAEYLDLLANKTAAWLHTGTHSGRTRQALTPRDDGGISRPRRADRWCGEVRVATLQVDLEGDKCHNRSYVSDDNPLFKVQSITLFATEASTHSRTIELPGFIGNIDNYLSWQ